ncbi:MAG: SPOR domain-containing protein [Clostridium sp.]|uniref:SPOR domain-containing protein n=1 Tax=Clostridium sp. TaxID=1506 RepID=UPI0039EA39DA
MRYTRYDIKRKKKGNKFYVVAVFIVLICAILIGTLISNIFLKNNSSVVGSSESKAVFNQNNSVDFVFLQCGTFTKKENAQDLMNKLGKIGNPFEVQDNGNIRVMFGIYDNKKDYDAAVKLLRDNKFEVQDINYSLSKNDVCDSQIISILNASLQVINKTYDKDVKEVQTAALKDWTKKLDKVDGNYKNKVVLEEIKQHIDKLPASFSKDNANEDKVFLYSEFKKLSK